MSAKQGSNQPGRYTGTHDIRHSSSIPDIIVTARSGVTESAHIGGVDAAVHHLVLVALIVAVYRTYKYHIIALVVVVVTLFFWADVQPFSRSLVLSAMLYGYKMGACRMAQPLGVGLRGGRVLLVVHV